MHIFILVSTFYVVLVVVESLVLRTTKATPHTHTHIYNINVYDLLPKCV
jgi:hypothetical protein